MTGMEHAIEQAERLIDDILSADPQVANEMFGDEPDKIARALAAAGLLAPAPLTEIRAENQFGETHRRWATDWELVDRAEGDGRAE